MTRWTVLCFFSTITYYYLSSSVSLATIYRTGQEQRRKVEPQGPEKAALQEDAAGALRYTFLSVSPTSSS